MTALAGVLTLLLHAALVLAAAPVLAGLLGLARARLLGRSGPPVLQPWRDLVRLARKQPVLAEDASWLFAALPGVCVAATLAAALLVPSFALGMATAPLADLLVIAGLLALARCALALAGLDTGTAAGGMGASRATLFAAHAEPVLLLVFLLLALLAGTTNLDAVAAALREGGQGLRLPLGLALLATCAVALAGTGAQDTLALEYSGRHLALVEYAAALRLLLWLSLIAAMFLPFGLAPAGAGPVAWIVGLLAWAGKLGGLCAGLLLLEAGAAGLRVLDVPRLLGAALLLALLAALLLFVSQGFA